MAEQPEVEELAIEICPSENGNIIIATVNRPEKLNALNGNVKEAIKSLCSWAQDSKDVSVVIFRGASPLPPPEGKRQKPHAFVAGADVSEFIGKNSETIRPEFEDNVWEAVWKLRKPTIALIDGYALGGGSELALSCDIRVATSRSMFGTPEINLGLIPGGGGTQRLTWLVGYGKAMEMMMSGNNVDAEEAHRLGIANQLCTPEELLDTTMTLAQTIAGKSMHTLRVAKKTIRAALDNSLTEGVKIEALAFANLFDTEDKEIGVQAFLNRSEPKWVHK